MHIELRDISYRLGDMHILERINLTVESGECVSVSGRSGCGKSMLFSILCGTLAATEGEVFVNRLAMSQMDHEENQVFRKYLGAVFQRAALISNLTVIENLLLPLNLHFPELDEQTKLNRIHAIASEFGFYNCLEWRTDRMSMGMRSLAGLARAVLNEPKYLIWDAPLIDVDIHWSGLVKQKLMQIKDSGATIILLSNRQEFITELADRRFTLMAGQLRSRDAV